MSGYFDDSPCVGFEGPEKRLEFVFRPKTSASVVPSRGLRLITKSDWQAMCTVARCNIISQTSNQYCDSFVLSESSLFVYPTMVMIKTCGTTALLQAIAKIIEYGERYNLEVAQVLYSRKNFLFPTVQPEVHRDWSNEVALLDTHFDGQSYVFGSTNQDHWNLYYCDYTDGEPLLPLSQDHSVPPSLASRRNAAESPLESNFCIMMQGLASDVSAQFYKREDQGDQDKFPGMDTLIDFDDEEGEPVVNGETLTDEFNFTPCGYSMNGLKGKSFYTIHVTPEAHCSYASFETNASLSPKQHQELISRILAVFKPNKATLTITSNPEGAQRRPNPVPDHEKSSSDSEDESAAPDYMTDYLIKYKTMTSVENDRNVIMVNLESHQYAAAQKKNRPAASAGRRMKKSATVNV